MKKIISFLCAVSMLLASVSCGKTENETSEESISVTSETNSEDIEATTTTAEVTQTTTEATTTPKETTVTTVTTVTVTTETEKKRNISDLSGLSIDVDGAAEIVEVTLPATLIMDIESAIANAESDERIISYTLNSDDSITFQYSKEEYDVIMDEYKTDTENSLQEIATSGKFPSITAIDYNNNFSDITVTVTDQSSYEKSFDAISELSIYISAGYYQVFLGIKDPNVTIHIVDSYGNEFKTV